MTDEVERQKAEDERVAAEDERVEAEEVRREAEGGPPDFIETGRVEAEDERIEAEEGRVVAEEKRASVRNFYAKLGGLIILPVAFIALVPTVVGLVLVNKQINDNRNLIDEQRRALLYLCDTTAVLDLVVTQLELVDRGLIKDPSLDPGVKTLLRERVHIYHVARIEFANRRSCEGIE